VIFMVSMVAFLCNEKGSLGSMPEPSFSTSIDMQTSILIGHQSVTLVANHENC
jgi:hypothetical protein